MSAPSLLCYNYHRYIYENGQSSNYCFEQEIYFLKTDLGRRVSWLKVLFLIVLFIYASNFIIFDVPFQFEYEF